MANIAQLCPRTPLERDVRTWDEIPEAIRGRLIAEGLDSPSAWRAAGRRRFEVFGVTRRAATLLDRLARDVP
jgi:hypothetical protein